MAPERSLRTIALSAARGVPWPLWRPLVTAGAGVASLCPPQAVRDWQRNAQTLTGEDPSRRLTREAVLSWARNWIESTQIDRWSPQRVQRSVLVGPDDWARLVEAARTPGAVLALPHSGSWDMAGQWACLNGMPVSSVAELLEGAGEFEFFRELRESLGMRIHSHRDPRALPKLVEDAREGRLVCLLADRDFSRRGVPVVWPSPSGPQPATMPPGPAVIALQANVPLLPVISTYEGSRMRLSILDPILPDPGLGSRREQAAAMTQQLCTVFAERLAQHPQDWHMMRPFFTHATSTPPATNGKEAA